MKHWEKPQTLYHLVDPANEIPFYVGITTDPKTRLKDHQTNRRRSKRKGFNWKKYNFVAALKKQRVRIEMRIIASGLSLDDALDMEAKEIKRLRADGIHLVNIAEYGNVPQKKSGSTSRTWREGFEAAMRRLYGQDWQPKQKPPRSSYGAFVDGKCLGTWPTMKEAKRDLLIGKRRFRDPSQKVFGIEFKRTRESVERDIATLKAIVHSNRKRKLGARKCPVVSIDCQGRETTYSSIAEASRMLGIASAGIRIAMDKAPIRSRPRTSGGLQWKRAQ